MQDTDGTPFAGIFGKSYYFIAKDVVPPETQRLASRSSATGRVLILVDG